MSTSWRSKNTQERWLRITRLWGNPAIAHIHYNTVGLTHSESAVVIGAGGVEATRVSAGRMTACSDHHARVVGHPAVLEGDAGAGSCLSIAAPAATHVV